MIICSSHTAQEALGTHSLEVQPGKALRKVQSGGDNARVFSFKMWKCPMSNLKCPLICIKIKGMPTVYSLIQLNNAKLIQAKICLYTIYS